MNVPRRFTSWIAPLVVIALFGAAWMAVKPAPPKEVRFTSGSPGGAYHAFAERYAAILARDGVKVVVAPSEGTSENLKRLAADDAEYDVGFVQSGIATEPEREGLVTLGSVFYEPLWVFYRGPDMDRLAALQGKRVAVGPEGSGTRVLAVRALLSDRFDVSRLPIDILPFADYLNIVSSIILVWSALVLPELVCPDIRSRTLGLYIATAVSPRQYLAGKVLAAMIAMLGLTLLPILVLFVGNVFFATAPWAYLQDNAGQLPRILGSSLIVSAYWSLLGLAVASLTGRRAFAIGSLLGVVLISVIASAAVTEWTGRDGSGLALNLVAAPILAGRELFKHDPLVTRSQVSLTVAVVCALSAVALLRRYRGRE